MVRFADYNKIAGADFGVGGSRQVVGGRLQSWFAIIIFDPTILISQFSEKVRGERVQPIRPPAPACLYRFSGVSCPCHDQTFTRSEESCQLSVIKGVGSREEGHCPISIAYQSPETYLRELGRYTDQ